MFLSKILPATGLYCVAQLLPAGGFRHFFYADLTEAEAQIDALNNAGHTVYIAQATFDQEKIETARTHNRNRRNGERMKERSQANALYLKNFFLDIDCGEKWPLKNQREGAAALNQFISETKLPFPAVVNSGNGLYAHWVMEAPVPASQWQTIARLLKQVVAAYSPAIGGDASRTSDSASVLRPPGTVNRKPGKEEKPVVILKDMEPVKFMDFVRVLSAAAKKKRLDIAPTQAPKVSDDINSEFLVYQENDAIAELVADKCNQIAHVREMEGNVIEPLWYAAIGVLIFCKDGESFAHNWSTGHPDYSFSQTEAKIKQWRDSGMGPTTCAKLGGVNAEACVGCPFNGKIKSPIVLGRPVPAAIEAPEVDITPEGFKRSEKGLFVEYDGQWRQFYDQDLYLSQLAYDESLGYEVMCIRHRLPHEGELECTLRSSLVNDPKALLTSLSDNHIKVLGAKEKTFMTAYLESYQARLQRSRRMTMLLCQMGWKESRTGQPMFVLGKRIFHADGSVEDASLARNVPRAAEAFHTSGTLEAWTAATEVLARPDMEPFAFALLAGGFGAPLMKFTGHDGALVSMVGESGAGKTLMLRFIQSVYGYNDDLMMMKDDTQNAQVSRLGVYNNLPFTIDELTNIAGKDLSDTVYRLTQGRDKARLTRNAEERRTINSWNTLAVSSSNSSLLERLSEIKIDANAEFNRIFEYWVRENICFKGPVASNLYWTVRENYGHAGEKYVSWLVQHTEEVKKALTTMTERIEKEAMLKGEERYWGAIIATALTGGVIAKSLGLIKFDVTRVKDWAIKTVRTMRRMKTENASDPVGVLAQYLDEFAANRLIVTKDKATGKTIILEEPRGPLYIRTEIHSNQVFFPRTHFKSWVAKKFGSYTAIRQWLLSNGVLLNANCMKILGGGTTFRGGQQQCWQIDLESPGMGPVGRDVIDEAKRKEMAATVMKLAGEGV